MDIMLTVEITVSITAQLIISFHLSGIANKTNFLIRFNFV
jgi:hypothetical protein